MKKSHIITTIVLTLLGNTLGSMTTREEELFAAVSSSKDLQGKVMSLLAQGVNPNIKKFDPPLDKAISFDDREDTPLHIAIRNGHLVSANLLLIQNAHVNAKNLDDFTPLHEAIFLEIKKAKEAINLLYKYYADFNAENEYNKTPLDLAIQFKKFTIADHLINLGSYINKKDTSGNTSLHKAILDKNTEGIKYLLRNKVRYNYQNHKYVTPLDLALKIKYFTNFHPIASLILKKYINDNEDLRDSISLHKSIFLETEIAKKVITYLCKYGADFNLQDRWGNTPFYLTIKYEKFALSDLFIELGFNINKIDRWSRNTFVHKAVIDNNIKGVVYLLSKNNELRYAINSQNLNPLELAIYLNRSDIVNLPIFRQK